jgi:nitrilase
MVSSANVQDNLTTVAGLLLEAANQQAEMAVLPEYFCLMGHHDTDKLHIAEPFGDGPIQHRLSALAAQHAMWLVAGSMPLAVSGDSQHVTNSCLVFDPTGACVARYDKIHLFYFDNGKERYDEARVQHAGVL